MHGGEFETSFIMFTQPDLVREKKIECEVAEKWTRFSSSDYVNMDDTVPMASASHDWGADDPGHHGDPTKASTEKGEQLYEVIVNIGVEFLEDLYELSET